MASPVSIVRDTAPPLDPLPFIDQLQDAHAAALLDYSALETQIWNGERGLWIRLRLEQAERLVSGLRQQLAEELARVGGRA